MHKNPTKAMFIIAGPQMFSETTFESSYSCIKAIYKQIEHYNFKTQYWSGIKGFWPVQINEAVLDATNKTYSIEKAILGV